MTSRSPRSISTYRLTYLNQISRFNVFRSDLSVFKYFSSILKYSRQGERHGDGGKKRGVKFVKSSTILAISQLRRFFNFSNDIYDFVK